MRWSRAGRESADLLTRRQTRPPSQYRAGTNTPRGDGKPLGGPAATWPWPARLRILCPRNGLRIADRVTGSGIGSPAVLRAACGGMGDRDGAGCGPGDRPGCGQGQVAGVGGALSAGRDSRSGDDRAGCAVEAGDHPHTHPGAHRDGRTDPRAGSLWAAARHMDTGWRTPGSSRPDASTPPLRDASLPGHRRRRRALRQPVEVALLGAPAHPDAEDIRAHAEAVADVLIAGIAVTPPGPRPAGTAGYTSAPPGVLDDRTSSL